MRNRQIDPAVENDRAKSDTNNGSMNRKEKKFKVAKPVAFDNIKSLLRLISSMA